MAVEGGALPLETTHPAIGAHIDAIRVVLKERMRGDGGAVGRQLRDGLAAAVRKCRSVNRRGCAATCENCRKPHRASDACE